MKTYSVLYSKLDGSRARIQVLADNPTQAGLFAETALLGYGIEAPHIVSAMEVKK